MSSINDGSRNELIAIMHLVKKDKRIEAYEKIKSFLNKEYSYIDSDSEELEFHTE